MKRSGIYEQSQNLSPKQIYPNIKCSKVFDQKPAEPANAPYWNGCPKIHAAKKSLSLLVQASISLKPFGTGYFRPFRPGTLTTLRHAHMYSWVKV